MLTQKPEIPKTMRVRVLKGFYMDGRLVPPGEAPVELAYAFARELIANGKAEAAPAAPPAKQAAASDADAHGDAHGASKGKGAGAK